MTSFRAQMVECIFTHTANQSKRKISEKKLDPVFVSAENFLAGWAELGCLAYWALKSFDKEKGHALF